MSRDDDLWRSRIRADSFVRPDPGAYRPGTPAFLGKVVSTGAALGVGKFCRVVPVSITGTETDGSVGVLTAGTAEIFAYPVGPGTPVTGDYAVVRRVEHRWVFDKPTGVGLAPWRCTAPAPTLTMEWYYFVHPYPDTGGPLTTTLTWDGVGAFRSAVLALPAEAYACSLTALEGTQCCYYTLGISCTTTPTAAPSGFIGIWPDSTGPAGGGSGAGGVPSGTACNLPTNQALNFLSMTTTPPSAAYGANDTLGMASGMLTP